MPSVEVTIASLMRAIALRWPEDQEPEIIATSRPCECGSVHGVTAALIDRLNGHHLAEQRRRDCAQARAIAWYYRGAHHDR